MSKENNRLIAEFMDIQVRTYSTGSTSFEPDKSWDLLIPVLAKLNKLCVPYMTDESFPKNAISLKHSVLNNEIKVTYNCVITILKWYNKNKINE